MESLVATDGPFWPLWEAQPLAHMFPDFRGSLFQKPPLTLQCVAVHGLLGHDLQIEETFLRMGALALEANK